MFGLYIKGKNNRATLLGILTMVKNNYIWYFITTATMVAGCRKPYAPPAVLARASYLVVEGVIDSGSDSTLIALSRTVNIANHTSLLIDSGAEVAVEREDGANYPLSKFKGRYLVIGLNLDKAKKYRLHIKTGGDEYASDYEPVKLTPPIDSISYKITGPGLQINSSTHDVTNNARYYRWAYEEAWKFHAAVNSGLIVKNGKITFRAANEMYYYCYAGDKSSNIVLASSEKLSQDVISQNPVTLIPRNSEKLEIKYSIRLKQYALTKGAYAFWENLRKNTEQLGSIFDAQPSQLVGNIHSISNPAEPVVGYVSVTNMQSRRIFISKNVLPDEWNIDLTGCENNAYLFANPNTRQDDVALFILKGGLVPTSSVLDSLGQLIGYRASTVECTDCRVRGNINAPVFWQN